MQGDPLSDVLTSVRLRGAIFYYVSCDDHWVADTPPSPELADALSPGAEHVIAYHMILRGNGWVGMEGEAPTRLQAGD
ncbi:cupin domain-containing protein, partial [Klebsiella pneumoniae]|uniref:cupin domain-containing protein n=2 Tax=Pseudomonadota TaxID=1224 RepID=UPI00210AC6ED